MAILQKQHICLLITVTFSFFLSVDSFSQQKVNYRKVVISDSTLGIASFYADKFIGRKMANGQIFSQKKMTCAHNTYPMGTLIRVTNLSNKLSVEVTVTDRLHHRNPRLVDLTTTAAQKIKLDRKGVTKVLVERIYPLKRN
jgi:rare lipoprotein A